MPYIAQKARRKLDPFIRELGLELGLHEDHPGNLNYVVTVLARQFAEARGGNYEAFNAAIGVLESAKLELYRRQVAPYEDTKIRQNGDVDPDV
jgi:hypothetical protein